MSLTPSGGHFLHHRKASGLTEGHVMGTIRNLAIASVPHELASSTASTSAGPRPIRAHAGKIRTLQGNSLGACWKAHKTLQERSKRRTSERSAVGTCIHWWRSIRPFNDHEHTGPRPHYKVAASRRPELLDQGTSAVASSGNQSGRLRGMGAWFGSLLPQTQLSQQNIEILELTKT